MAVVVAASVVARVGGGGSAVAGGGGGGVFGGGGGRVIAGLPPGGVRQTYGSTTSGATLSQLISQIYDVPSPRLLIDFEPPEERYDVIVTSQGGMKNQIDAIRRQAIEAAFGLAAKHEQHDLDAYVLTVKDKEAKGLRPTQAANNSGWQGGAGTRSGVNIDFKSIVQQLEPLLKQPIVDETGLNGRYDFELKWDQPAIEKTPIPMFDPSPSRPVRYRGDACQTANRYSRGYAASKGHGPRSIECGGVGK